MNNKSWAIAIVTGLAVAATLSAQTNVFPTSGNVGIGTLSPREKLQVEGVVLASDQAGGATLGTLAFGVAYQGANIINTFGSQYSSAATIIGYSVKPKPGATGYVSSAGNWASPRGAIELTNELIFKNAGAQQVAIGNDVSLTERFRITSSGNVGIGTANPVNKLDISGGSLGIDGQRIASVDSNYIYYGDMAGGDGTRGLWLRAGDQNRVIVTTDGNVGIGTTTPSSILELNGGSSTNSLHISNSGESPWAVRIRNEQSTIRGLEIYQDNSGSTQLWNGYGSPAPAQLVFAYNGNVGIGTASPTHKLSVNGTIRAKEVIVDTGWADYVFADDYELASLDEVEAHIRDKKHLPGIPSAQDVAEQGVSLGEMQALLLAKIEELTLHQIAYGKKVESLTAENAELRERVAQLEKQ